MYTQMERYVGKVWKGPEHRCFCPWGLGGCITPPPYVDVHPPGGSLNPLLLGFHAGFLTGNDQS